MEIAAPARLGLARNQIGRCYRSTSNARLARRSALRQEVRLRASRLGRLAAAQRETGSMRSSCRSSSSSWDAWYRSSAS
jgi:hypothetical protein